jgi:ribosomal protein S18 acetylase RimI-like enzyme
MAGKNIRKIEPNELDTLAALYVRAYGDGWTVPQAKRYLEKFYGFEPASCLAARDESGRIVGAVLAYSYYRKEQLVLFVQELFVDPDFRNRGYGRSLLSTLRGAFAVSPAVNITPIVNAPPGLLAFYNSLGFGREQAFTFYDE